MNLFNKSEVVGPMPASLRCGQKKAWRLRYPPWCVCSTEAKPD
jgi:hypothetical protein